MNYRSHHFQVNSRKKMEHFNLGLLYYKYMPQMENEKDKQNFLRNFAILSKSSDFSILKTKVALLKGESDLNVLMTNQTRFLCGVGYQSRMEWGLSFDWTTGIPFLPGSSFKGALLSYLEFTVGKAVEKWNDHKAKLENGDEWSKNEVYQIFGSQDENDEKKAGSVVFFDVYPKTFKGLEVDVITPHYQPYYRDPKHNPPADIYNPVPLYFLTIAVGSEFLFLLKFRKEIDKKMSEKLERLIRECGKNYGFGAKTATGYGYFE